jgi:hypothetical protein
MLLWRNLPPSFHLAELAQKRNPSEAIHKNYNINFYNKDHTLVIINEVFWINIEPADVHIKTANVEN